MRSVAILKNSPNGEPGRIADFLRARDIAFDVVDVDAGAAVPTSPARFAGIVLMGGPMSVNDDLPWIEPECALVRAAVEAKIPVAGHCLGAQLMSRALGGSVTRNPVREFGWGTVEPVDGDLAREWMGEDAKGPIPTLHWHGETFTLPVGARHLLTNVHCANQAFVLDDRHLGLQCHFETPPTIIRRWAESAAGSIGRSVARGEPGSQPVEEILSDLETRAAAIHRVLDALYARWIQGLVHV